MNGILTTAKGTGLAETAGKEDPAEFDFYRVSEGATPLLDHQSSFREHNKNLLTPYNTVATTGNYTYTI